jgi:hypothetical protein
MIEKNDKNYKADAQTKQVIVFSGVSLCVSKINFVKSPVFFMQICPFLANYRVIV